MKKSVRAMGMGVAGVALVCVLAMGGSASAGPRLLTRSDAVASGATLGSYGQGERASKASDASGAEMTAGTEKADGANVAANAASVGAGLGG